MQKPGNLSPELKFLLCCKPRAIATCTIMLPPFMKKKKCRINTEISRFITTAFPQTVDNTSLFKRINRKGQEDQSLQRLLAIFPYYSF
jgi:hypothetical protein